MTTKDIIKILPFEEQFKNNLLSQFDGLSIDQKFSLEQILWETYIAFYNLKLDENIQLALLRAKDNQEPLNSNFYKKVQEQTDEQIQQEATKNIETKDLEAARIAMEKIVKEIKNSNLPIKAD